MVDCSWWVINLKGLRGKVFFWLCFVGDGKLCCVCYILIDCIFNNLYIINCDCDLLVSFL